MGSCSLWPCRTGGGGVSARRGWRGSGEAAGTWPPLAHAGSGYRAGFVADSVAESHTTMLRRRRRTQESYRAVGRARRLEDVVAWVGGFRDDRGSRDGAQAAGLVVLEGLNQFGAGVHDERAVRRDRLPDRLAAEQQDVQR